MELRVLRYFLTVAREENITRAAELLACFAARRFRIDCTCQRGDSLITTGSLLYAGSFQLCAFLISAYDL